MHEVSRRMNKSSPLHQPLHMEGGDLPPHEPHHTIGSPRRAMHWSSEEKNSRWYQPRSQKRTQQCVPVGGPHLEPETTPPPHPTHRPRLTPPTDLAKPAPGGCGGVALAPSPRASPGRANRRTSVGPRFAREEVGRGSRGGRSWMKRDENTDGRPHCLDELKRSNSGITKYE